MIGATLFSGIGAPEVAMPHWRWPWHAEIEKFPSAVMAARHPQRRWRRRCEWRRKAMQSLFYTAAMLSILFGITSIAINAMESDG